MTSLCSTGLLWSAWVQTPPPGSWWTCCPNGTCTDKTRSSLPATNSRSASLRCSREKVRPIHRRINTSAVWTVNELAAVFALLFYGQFLAQGHAGRTDVRRREKQGPPGLGSRSGFPPGKNRGRFPTPPGGPGGDRFPGPGGPPPHFPGMSLY